MSFYTIYNMHASEKKKKVMRNSVYHVFEDVAKNPGQRIQVWAIKLIWYCWTSRRLLTKSVAQSYFGSTISMGSEEMHYPRLAPSWVIVHRPLFLRKKNRDRSQWPQGAQGSFLGPILSCIHKWSPGEAVIAGALSCRWHGLLPNSWRLWQWNSATKWPRLIVRMGEPVGHGPASILHKSIAGRYRPVSYPDGPTTARYRFM